MPSIEITIYLTNQLGNGKGLSLTDVVQFGICKRASNAASEWEAGRLWWRSTRYWEACPLEGLVRQTSDELYPVQ